MTDTALALTAYKRDAVGSAASRRLRRQQDIIPAVIYGNKKATTNISLSHKEVVKLLENEDFYSQVLQLNLDANLRALITLSLFPLVLIPIATSPFFASAST